MWGILWRPADRIGGRQTSSSLSLRPGVGGLSLTHENPRTHVFGGVHTTHLIWQLFAKWGARCRETTAPLQPTLSVKLSRAQREGGDLRSSAPKERAVPTFSAPRPGTPRARGRTKISLA